MHINNGTAQFESQEPEERIETDTVSVRDTLLKSKVTMKDSSYRKESRERLEVEPVESNVEEEQTFEPKNKLCPKSGDEGTFG